MKVIVITGASSGIGAELALKAAANGYFIAICARRKEKLESVQQSIEQNGGKCFMMQADISIKEQAEQFIHNVISHYGRIDILVNNAGRGNLASVEDTTEEQLLSIFGVNVFSLWYITAPALIQMKLQGYGHIINIASVAGTMGFPFNSAYVAAKHAVMGFTASLRAELAGSDIHATAICPDGVITEWGMVTEGGEIGKLFMSGIRESRSIAREKGIGLAPLAAMITAKSVADIILQTAEFPPEHDIYTHVGTHERAMEFAENRWKAEQKMLAFYLGMQKSYSQS